VSNTLPDTAILGPRDGALPLALTTAPGQELTPRTAFASFDGTAAATPFLASLAFYAPDGTLLSRTFPTTQVPAGGTADVSFAPFPGGMIQSATPATASSVDLLYEYVVTGAPQLSIDTNVDGPMAGPLPQTYQVLEVWTYARTDENTTGGLLEIQFNNDTGARYDQVFSEIQIAGGVAGQVYGRNLNANFVEARIPGLGNTAGHFGTCRFSIPQYASAAFPHTGEGQGGMVTTGANDAQWMDFGFTYHPAPAAAISRIRIRNSSIGNNLVVDSALYVYGRK
jgi:hypothetical protein